jgi:hypothetical protein
MRRILSILMLLALASSCTADAKRVYADARWWAVCPVVNPWQGCQAGEQHDLRQTDGDVVGADTFRASCFADENNGQLSVSFSVQDGEDLIDVRGIVTSRNGGPVLPGGCSVLIVEDENSYEGDCGPAVPSADQPCQIQEVVVDRGDADGKSVTVRLQCNNLPWDASPERSFNLRDSASTSSPASLRLANCRGL